MLECLEARAGIRQDEAMWAHWSLSCTPESIINRLEVCNGRGRGEHAGKGREQEQATLTEAMIASIQGRVEARKAWTFTVEQPKGSALTPTLTSALGEPQTVYQCCYGYKHAKPTLIWTNLTPAEWTPRPYAKGACLHCEACNTGTMHEQYVVRRGKGDKRKRASQEGFTQKAVRNRIAPDLAEEIAIAARAKWEGSCRRG